VNILIVRLSAIGDCTLVLPVIRAILEQRKDATITWLIGRAAYELLKDCVHPRLSFIVVDKPKSLGDYRKIKRLLDNYYDVLFAMQASTRVNLIYPLVKAKRKIGFDKTRARELQWLFTNERIEFESEHLHDSFRKFAQKLNINPSPADGGDSSDYRNWHITTTTDVEHLNLPERYIVINPAASKIERSWFVERYIEVIEYCYKKYALPVVLTGSDADFEQEIVNDISATCTTPLINLVGKTGLQQLAVVLQKSEFCIAPDTGPAHIANAMNTRVIGLYAVAPSRLSGPYLFQDLTVDKFEQAVERILHKNPKQVPWRTRVHDRGAMALISADDVKAKIDKLASMLNLRR